MNIFQRIRRFFSTSQDETPLVEDAHSATNTAYKHLEKTFNLIPSIRNSVQFIIDEETIHVNGKGSANSLSRTLQDADVTITIPKEVFNEIISENKPFDLLQHPNISYKGDIGLIIKIQTILNAAK